MRRTSLLALLATAWITGCGMGNFTASVPATSIPPVTGYALYHAYGDSITAGVGVSNVSFVYASLAASYNHLTLTDYAISGDQACDVPTRQIFANADSPALASAGLYSLLIGTNDATFRGAGANETTFNLCDQAAISWLATPLESKLLATAGSVQVSGASHLETQDNFNAVTTDALGATITFPFTRSVAAPVYLWYRITDNNPYSFTCGFDGGAETTFNNAPAPAIQTYNNTTTSVGVYRFGAVAAGSHSLRCTQRSAGTFGMGLIAIGGPPAAGTAMRPRLLVGLLSPQLNGAHSTDITAYDADIRSNVALFAGDGLDVELFDASKYMTGTTADLFDLVHPNVLGQQEIFQAFEQVLN